MRRGLSPNPRKELSVSRLERATHATDTELRKMSKRQKLDLDRLLRKIVSLLVRHNPKDLTFSRVSQLTKVPRSTLYYYFGSSRESMLIEAIKYGMHTFAQISQFDEKETYSNWEENQRVRLNESIRIIQHSPWAPGLFFKFRGDAGEIGKTIRGIETAYFEKLSRQWKHYHPGREPDMQALKLATYLKIGFFYGFANEIDFWTSTNETKALEKLLKTFNKIVSDLMRTEF